jgi:hypothetical protein
VAKDPISAGAGLSEEVTELVHGLVGEGERATVVVGAARLDLALEHLLKGAMHHHPGGSEDNLFDQDRPLGTFSSRIALAYRLGLIDRDVERALQLIRRIRNDFAHTVGVASLSDAAHSSRLRELIKLCRCGTLYAMLELAEEERSIKEPVHSFCCALIVVIVCLEVVVRDIAPFTVARPAAFR